ncbi:hypothetical protein L9F63_007410, partial [Diploptera punctata]
CPDQDLLHKRFLQYFDPSTETYISKELEDVRQKVRFLYVHGKENNQEVSEFLNEFDK